MSERSLAAIDRDFTLSVAAALVAAFALLSGPIAFALTLLHPQPAWTDAATFAAHAHPIQQLPYWLGFGLLGSCVLLVARIVALSWQHSRTRALVVLVLTAMYGGTILVNYALQVAYVPALARAGSPLVAYVTMANPEAPTWLLEMFGYGALGAATWIAAPLFGAHRRWIRRLLVANGIVSIAGAIACAGGMAWLQTVPGLVAYLAWNALFVAAAVAIALDLRPRRDPRSAARTLLHTSA
jgi:hypothetical protein